MRSRGDDANLNGIAENFAALPRNPAVLHDDAILMAFFWRVFQRFNGVMTDKWVVELYCPCRHAFCGTDGFVELMSVRGRSPFPVVVCRAHPVQRVGAYAQLRQA